MVDRDKIKTLIVLSDILTDEAIINGINAISNKYYKKHYPLCDSHFSIGDTQITLLSLKLLLDEAILFGGECDKEIKKNSNQQQCISNQIN